MGKTIYPLPGSRQVAREGNFAGPVSFSNGVKVSGGEMVFVSGQLAFDENMALVGKGDISAQTRQVLENIGKVLRAAGGSFKDVVRVTVFVKDITQFRAIHDVRLQYFDADNLPASTMVEIREFVHPDALIEIDAVAVVGG